MKVIREVLVASALMQLLPNTLTFAQSLADVSADANGDLLALFAESSPGTAWNVVNVSAITGHKLVGAATRWQTQDGSMTLEHLAGVSPSRHLLVFSWSPPDPVAWQAIDVSRLIEERFPTLVLPTSTDDSQTDKLRQALQVVGPLTNWQVQVGSAMVERLAAVNSSGDLLVFSRSPDTDWNVVNVSDRVGPKIGNVSAGIAGYDVTTDQVSTGQQVVGPVTNWQVQVGSVTVEHVAGVSLNGELLDFSWSPVSDWEVVNISRVAAQQGITNPRVAGPLPQVVGPLTNWQVQYGWFSTENLAGVSPNGDLLVFFRSSWLGLWWLDPLASILRLRADWQVVNVSRITTIQVAGVATSWVNGSVAHVVSNGPDGRFIVFWNTLEPGQGPNLGWGFCNIGHNACSFLLH
jgi:hypothetical protein